MDWPANSPDLNPMENIWGDMVRMIYAGGQQYQGVSALKKAIIDAWHQIDRKKIDNLILSMDEQIFQCKRRTEDQLIINFVVFERLLLLL